MLEMRLIARKISWQYRGTLFGHGLGTLEHSMRLSKCLRHRKDTTLGVPKHTIPKPGPLPSDKVYVKLNVLNELFLLSLT